MAPDNDEKLPPPPPPPPPAPPLKPVSSFQFDEFERGHGTDESGRYPARPVVEPNTVQKVVKSDK